MRAGPRRAEKIATSVGLHRAGFELRAGQCLSRARDRLKYGSTDPTYTGHEELRRKFGGRVGPIAEPEDHAVVVDPKR